MAEVFDDDGKSVAEISLSYKQYAALTAGTEITVMFHTPQLMRGLLGERSGSFTLREVAGRLVTRDRKMVEKFADMHKAVDAAQPRIKGPG